MKLIKLKEDHYVVVDETEIKEGDWYYDTNDKKSLMPIYQRSQDPKFYSGCKKITHSTQPLDKNGYWGKVMPLTLTIFEIKELIGEVDVDKKAEILYPFAFSGIGNAENDKKEHWIKGYTQALEDNKERKYTEEDVISFIQKIARKYFNEGREYKGNMAIAGDPLHGLRSKLKKYIQSLQPKTEWEVEMVDGKLKLK